MIVLLHLACIKSYQDFRPLTFTSNPLMFCLAGARKKQLPSVSKAAKQSINKLFSAATGRCFVKISEAFL